MGKNKNQKTNAQIPKDFPDILAHIFRLSLCLNEGRRDLRDSMKLHQSLKSKVCILLTVFVGFSAMAQEVVTDNLVEVPPQDLPLVEVQIPQDNLAPYKERRETHGVYFGMDYEAINFKNFISTLDGMSYKDLFGEDTVNLVQAGLDYKFNFSLGSVSAGLFYGMGKVDADGSRSLEISKYGAAFRFMADMIMSEPYVVPYLGISAWQMGISEKSATDSFSATTQMGYNYALGFLIQLDWIDYDTAKETTFNWGLENTFLDVYATQYAKTEAPDDPNTETDFTYGAGLRFEF